MARELSFKGKVQLLLAFEQQLRLQGGQVASALIMQLLKAISTRRL